MSDYKLLRNNKDSRFCFIDFETCNLCLHECHNLPFQASMIVEQHGEIQAKHDFYIKWPHKINVSKEAAIITKYNEDVVQSKGVPPEEVLDCFDEEFKKADYIGGHSLIGFDVYVSNLLYRKLGRTPYNIVPKILDTFPIAKAIKLEIPYNRKDNFSAWQYRLYHFRVKGIKCSLGALGKEYEIKHSYENLHNSLSDLELNLKLWNKLKYQIEI